MADRATELEAVQSGIRSTGQDSAQRAASAALRQAYGEVPYEGSLHAATHPDALAAMAHMLGMTPAPVADCRVLELGCNDGTNLIPLALGLPKSHCLGIDIADAQIAKGRALAAQLGLKNLDLRVADILELDDDLGPFDYIIGDGVFSWVPPDVQDKMLRICARCLAPQGVVFIGFNAYPGWHVRGMVRDMLRIHTRDAQGARAKITAARQFLERLGCIAADANSPLGVIQEEISDLRRWGDAYLFHEHLGDYNCPFYFRDFIDRALAHGLQYLAEVPARDLDSDRWLAEISALGGDPRDRVQVRQYQDFFEREQYHCSLLCHASVPLLDRPSPKAIQSLLVASSFQPRATVPAVGTAQTEEFVSGDGWSMTTGHPFVKAALVSLSRHWPLAVSFAELWAMVCEQLRACSEPFPIDEDSDPELLAESLVQCYLRKVVDLRTRNPDLSAQAGSRPLASPLARLQASTTATVSTLLHREIQLEPLDQTLVQWLDGSRDRQTLIRQLEDLDRRGAFPGKPGRAANPDSDIARLDELVDQSLARLAAQALLMPGAPVPPFEK
jgi:SAM-dependent methyltransferase